MILISAVGKKNRVIGKGNSLPWHIPAEYEHFKEKVRGFPVIMGRKTYQLLFKGEGQEYEEIPPASQMIVVTRDPDKLRSEDERWKGVTLCRSLEDAMKEAAKTNKKFFCAGGESLYREAVEKELADEMYLSEIEGDYDQGSTAHFPDFNRKKWQEVSRERHNDGPGWDFVMYKLKR